MSAEFETFRSNMEQKWGSFKERSNTQWVEYIDKGNTLVEVDFEVDEVSIDFLYEDPDDARNTVQELPYKILEVINEFYGGGPVGIESLCATLNEDRGTLEDVYEPFLLKIGFLKRTPRGREITELAKDHLSD